jgi:RNA polymerase sigma-54 factor
VAIAQRLDLRQTQALVMTPQLQQAIKLLQLSNMELTEFVDGELERNPLLERDEGEGDEPSRADGGVDGGIDGADERPRAGDGEAEPDVPDAHELTSRETLPETSQQPLDADDSNLWGSAGAGEGDEAVQNWREGGTRTDFPDEDSGFESTLTREITLRDHLLQQLGMAIDDPVGRIIGTMLIDMVDAAGYLVGDPAEVAEKLGCPPERVTAVLEVLQRCEPTGVCARNLAECLALQLAERDRLDPAMKTLLDNLPLLASRDRAQLMKLCGIDAEDLADMVAEIRSLNPKPGETFGSEPAPPVIPDVLMRASREGGWLVELNAETLPRVLVNTRYHAQVVKGKLQKSEKDYLSERLQSANWLVKSLHQRATTILKVASEIVRQQDGFFRFGVQHLRPLILRDIAEAIEMHESTVSRVTSNKFIATPRGVFELKYFFTASIPSSQGGGAHSAEAVRHRIKELIDGEPAHDVLSDDKLVEILSKEGIEIARRTVAKYRESLRISSSVQRRRDKAMAL